MTRGRGARFACLAGPALLYVGVLLVAPLLLMGAISLFTYLPSRMWAPVLTLQNYRKLLSGYYLGVTRTTIEVALYTTVLSTALGYPVAYHLARCRGARRSVYLILLVAPLMVSTVIRVLGWIVILGRQGFVTRLLAWSGLVPGSTGLLYHEAAVVAGLTELLLPFMVLPLMAAIERIPRSVEEAARTLGANGFELFRRVVFPLSLPGLISGSLLVYSVSVSALVTPALMGGPKVYMLGNLVYDNVLTSLNWPFASSVSVTLLLITGLTMFFYLNLMRASEAWRGRG